jgi:hypothetical protein
LLSQYKSKQHHVIAAKAYLLFGQKSTNLTIFFSFHCTYYTFNNGRNIISFGNTCIKKKTLTRFDENNMNLLFSA